MYIYMQPAYLCPVTVFWHPASFGCQKMSELELFPSDNEPDAPPQATCSKAQLGQASGSKAPPSQASGSKAPPSAGSKALPPRPGSTAEPQASARGRRPTRPDTRTPKPRSLRSPPPSYSYASASPSIPPIGKWTVAGLRQALSNSEVKFSRKMSKAQLYDLYVSLENTNSPTSKKVTKARKTKELSCLSNIVFFQIKFRLPASVKTQQAISKPGPCPRLGHSSHCTASLFFSTNHRGTFSYCAARSTAHGRDFPISYPSHSLPSTFGRRR